MTHKLLNTTAFRLSLVYALGFSLIAAFALGISYWFSAQLIRQQTDDRLQLETSVLLSRYYTGNFADLNRQLQNLNHPQDKHFFVYALVSRQQHNFFHDINPRLNANKAVFTTLPLSSITELKSATNAKRDTRILLTPLSGGYQLIVGTDLGEQTALLEHIGGILLIAILVIFTAAILGGSWIGYGVIQRLDLIRETANNIINGDLSQRLPVRGQQDEYDKLSRVLNRMLIRLQKSMQSMREVTDNLAHDLRNPLNRLRHRLEALSYQNTTPSLRQRELAIAVDDVDAIIATFNALLNIAQIEAESQHNHRENINIHKLIIDICELYKLLAEEKQLQLHCFSETTLMFYADRQLLAQALSNLLDNAIKYTPAGGEIRLQAYHENKQLYLVVSDTGSGIPVDQHERVFQRFVRLDNVRNTDGSGLGLSLVKAVAELHEAQIQLQDNKPGLRVIMRFPIFTKENGN